MSITSLDRGSQSFAYFQIFVFGPQDIEGHPLAYDLKMIRNT